MKYNCLEDDISLSFHEVGQQEGEKQDQNTFKVSLFSYLEFQAKGRTTWYIGKILI